MFEYLAKRINYDDAKCIEPFREGALIGIGACRIENCFSHCAVAGSDVYNEDAGELWRTRRESNRQLLESLRSDPNEEGLHEIVKEDAQKQRMMGSFPALEWDLGLVLDCFKQCVVPGARCAL